jgi:hypothetical protein
MEDLRGNLALSQAKANLASALLSQSLVELDRLRKADAELHALRVAHHALINSTSWRMTAPLRRTVTFLQKHLLRR